MRADDPDKRRRVRLVRPGAQPVAKKAKAAAKKAKQPAKPKQPAKKKAKSAPPSPGPAEDPAPAPAPAPAAAAAAGLAAALKMSLGYPDNWQPLESMSYLEAEVDKHSQEFASIAVLMNGTIAALHKVGRPGTVARTFSHILSFCRTTCRTTRCPFPAFR